MQLDFGLVQQGTEFQNSKQTKVASHTTNCKYTRLLNVVMNIIVGYLPPKRKGVYKQWTMDRTGLMSSTNGQRVLYVHGPIL